MTILQGGSVNMEMDERMSEISLATIKMFDTTLSFLEEAISVYMQNIDASQLKMDDDSIDRLERKIEEGCLHIILKERPFAKDLRKVTGIFKLVEDIERLGDHAEDLVWTITNLNNYNKGIKIESLTKEIQVAMSMVKDSYRALAKGDVSLAKEIEKRDDVEDSLYLESLKDIPTYKDKYNFSDEFILYATLLAKYSERIADHASNIAEWVVYIENGYYKDEVII